jgi:hypothetical protein
LEGVSILSPLGLSAALTFIHRISISSHPTNAYKAGFICSFTKWIIVILHKTCPLFTALRPSFKSSKKTVDAKSVQPMIKGNNTFLSRSLWLEFVNLIIFSMMSFIILMFVFLANMLGTSYKILKISLIP